MAYPLLTGTTRTASAVRVDLPAEAVVLASGSRTQEGFPTYQRTAAGVTVWQLPLPPQTGQIWPRS